MGGYTQTFRKCADRGKHGGRDGQAENVQLRDDGDLEQGIEKREVQRLRG